MGERPIAVCFVAVEGRGGGGGGGPAGHGGGERCGVVCGPGCEVRVPGQCPAAAWEPGQRTGRRGPGRPALRSRRRPPPSGTGPGASRGRGAAERHRRQPIAFATEHGATRRWGMGILSGIVRINQCRLGIRGDAGIPNGSDSLGDRASREEPLRMESEGGARSAVCVGRRAKGWAPRGWRRGGRGTRGPCGRRGCTTGERHRGLGCGWGGGGTMPVAGCTRGRRRPGGR